jgi:S1-C subfamily serine protease
MRGILVLIFVLASAFRAVPEDVPIKTVQAIQQSVVPVLCLKHGGSVIEIDKIMGTGFFVNREGYFLTAAHVVLDLKSGCPNGSAWAIYVPQAPWTIRTKVKLTQWFRFDECRYNQQTDVAVCKPVDNPFAKSTINRNIQPVRFGTFADFSDGSPIAFTGFPLGSVTPVTSKGFIASYFPTDDLIAIDKSAWEGASGSPVYDVKGNVIGLLILRTAHPAGGLSFARPIEPILEFLTKERIAIEKKKGN